MKQKKYIKINLALLLMSVILSLYLVEISLFLWEPKPWERSIAREKAARKAGLPYDTRTGWQILQDLRKEGIDAYPIIFPHRLLPDGLTTANNTIFPLGAISNKITVLCNESGKWVKYLADEYGFNNPSKSWMSLPPDIMLIGDSFAQGICVDPEDNIAGQLIKSGWKVINIGIGGNGPLLELASITEYVQQMRPETVLWLYYEDNDLADLEKEKKSPLIMKYLNKDFSQGLFNRQAEIDQTFLRYIEKKIEIYEPPNIIFDLMRLKHFYFRISLLKRALNKGTFKRPEPGLLFRETLKKARDKVMLWGGKMYFIYLPKWERYSEEENFDRQRFNLYRQEVLSIVQDLDIPVIDMHQEVFIKHDHPMSLFPLSMYGHYNAEGYRLIAETIDRHLKSRSKDWVN